MCAVSIETKTGEHTGLLSWKQKRISLDTIRQELKNNSAEPDLVSQNQTDRLKIGQCGQAKERDVASQRDNAIIARWRELFVRAAPALAKCSMHRRCLGSLAVRWQFGPGSLASEAGANYQRTTSELRVSSGIVRDRATRRGRGRFGDLSFG
jgi:hypothetical protein